MINNRSIWHLKFAQDINDDTKPLTIIFKYVFPVIASGLLGLTLPQLFKVDVPENIILLVIVSLILIMWGLFLAVLKLIAVEELRNTHRVTISKEEPFSGIGRITAFDYCTTIAKQAKKSIYVVGPHFSNSIIDGPERESHDDYLSKGMTAAIERHAHDEKTRFTYFRILQLDPEMMDTVKHEGEIKKHAIGDEILANHLDQCLTMPNNGGYTDIEIHARDFVPSLPSILVIDDQYVFFSLPTHIRNSLRGDYDFVFEIEDKSEEIPNQFKTVIKKLKSKDSIAIKSIV